MGRQPSPLMTAREVAHVWHLSKKTVLARVKPGSAKRNRIEPCMVTPDLRWKREEVYADLERMSFHREFASPRGRQKRVA